MDASKQALGADSLVRSLYSLLRGRAAQAHQRYVASLSNGISRSMGMSTRVIPNLNRESRVYWIKILSCINTRSNIGVH